MLAIQGDSVEEIWRSMKRGIEESVVRKRIKVKEKKIGEKNGETRSVEEKREE